MSRRMHFVATAFLLVVFATYGLGALTIPLFPGQEDEPFKPRTMPAALAIVGLALAAIRSFQLFAAGDEPPASQPRRLHWRPVGLLCLAMLGYGFLMVPAGFIVATMLFLVAGFWVLGERRRSVLLFLPLAFSVLFFLLMTVGLGLYLSPGTWWSL